MKSKNDKSSVVKGGEQITYVAEAIFNSNEKNGKIKVSTKAPQSLSGLKYLIADLNSEYISSAIFEANQKDGKVKTEFGNKTYGQLLAIINHAKTDKLNFNEHRKLAKGYMVEFENGSTIYDINTDKWIKWRLGEGKDYFYSYRYGYIWGTPKSNVEYPSMKVKDSDLSFPIASGHFITSQDRQVFMKEMSKTFPELGMAEIVASLHKQLPIKAEGEFHNPSGRLAKGTIIKGFEMNEKYDNKMLSLGFSKKTVLDSQTFSPQKDIPKGAIFYEVSGLGYKIDGDVLMKCKTKKEVLSESYEIDWNESKHAKGGNTPSEWCYSIGGL